MLTKDNALLVVIDFQGNLAQAMYQKEALFAAAEKIIQGARAFGIPLIVTEQIPAKLGPTIPEISRHLDGVTPKAKECFSCLDNEVFAKALKAAGRSEVLLCGIETHICVYQTAMGLLAQGYGVHLVTDAVSSRTKENNKTGIKRMRQEGVKLTSVEMALFEILSTAASPHFKDIFKIIK